MDFRQSEKLLTPVIIQGEEVGMVQTYKYLCVHKLGRSDKRKALYKSTTRLKEILCNRVLMFNTAAEPRPLIL